MKILVSWLRDFVAVDVTVQELADALTMRGFEVSDIEPAPSRVVATGEDAVLDLEITTNRPDCMGVRGVAREISTIYETELQPLPALPTTPPNTESASAADVSVVLEDSELCPRYVASVADVTVGPSPGWLTARLEATGVRSVNNVVDATNYVMVELGHPLHAFDLAKLEGAAIRIRRATSGETIRTLDGDDRRLDTDMLVIADAVHPQALAGVMGGAESEVTGTTRVVALESAYFLPTSIRRTSKRVGLSTDASYRFERGTDIEAPVVAMHRLRHLLAEIGAGQPRGAVIDKYPHPRTPPTIELRQARVGRVLGIDIDGAFIATTLSRLGFSVEPIKDGTRWRATVPTHRVDVAREVDLIEEIARHYGYDRPPSTFPALTHPPAPTGGWLRQQRLLRRVLTACGCSEAITYSFIERAAAAPFVSARDQIVGIANPLSEKFAVLRPSLLPGLVDSIVRNRRREHRDVRLFEIGKRFREADGETATVGFAVTGTGAPDHWSAASRNVDLFDITGIAERVCDAVGVTPVFEATEHPTLVAGRAAVIHASHGDGPAEVIGHVGQLLPAIAVARGFPDTGDELYVAELDLDAVDRVTVNRGALHTVPVPRHPSIVRDLAIIVDATLHASAVRGTIRMAASETLVSIQEFDRYEGEGVPDGRVSLAFRLTFRASSRTLTDVEIQRTMGAIVSSLQTTHQAKLR